MPVRARACLARRCLQHRCCSTALLFGCVLDRPLSLRLPAAADRRQAGTRRRIDRRPKLVILAGSNGPYSHRCEIIEPIAGHALRQCRRRGRHRPRLPVRPLAAAAASRRYGLSADGGGAVRPHRVRQPSSGRTPRSCSATTGARLRHCHRSAGSAALFSFDLRAALMSLIETALVAAHFHDPRAASTGATNAWGDHVGHTAALAAASQAASLPRPSPHHATADADRATGYGSALIAEFTRWATASRRAGRSAACRPSSPMHRCRTRHWQAIRSIYLANGGEFLELPNLSRYPRSAFFDTADHLNETWQIEHSKLLAAQLAMASRAHCSSSSCRSSRSSGTHSKPTD